MKHFLFSLAVTLSLAGVLTSCSNDAATVMTPNTVEYKKSEILLQLQTINDSLTQTLVIPQSRGWGWLDRLALVTSDVLGACEGGKWGGAAGGIVGTVFGGVGAAPGALIGGAVGATLGGISASYLAYKTCGGYEIPSTELEYFMNGYEKACSVTVDHDDEADEVTIKVLDMSDDLENIGRLHNKTMDYLLASENQITVHSDPIPEIPEGPEILETPVFTAFELEVLNSDMFRTPYDEFVAELPQRINNGITITSDGSVKDEIMALYIEALGNYTSPDYYEDVVNITNHYTQIVLSSSELTEIEKNQLCIAFAVGVYSYQYWSVNYSEE